MPARVTSGENDESWETLDDIVDNSSGFLKRSFGELSKASVAKQLTVGGVTGWCSGYIFSKVGRVAAMSIGGGLLLIQVAHHKGLIEIKWNKINKNLKAQQKKLSKDAERLLPYIAREIYDFTCENAVLAGGYAGGFLIGMAC